MLHLWKIIIKNKYHIASIAFWIITWQIMYIMVGKEYLLASPKGVVSALFHLVQTTGFWKSICCSFGKIALGFLVAVICGVLSALLSCKNPWVKEILSVMMRVIKSIPVASFVIVALLWVKSGNLSVLISFLMVLPVIYTNVLKGIESTDRLLLEMADVFRIPLTKKIRFIYIPAVMPYFVTACSVGLGFCWKSGIAAEVIGLPRNSIGSSLYEAKLYLMTKELFAWTIVIVLLSILFEKLVMKLIHFAERLFMGNGFNKHLKMHN